MNGPRPNIWQMVTALVFIAALWFIVNTLIRVVPTYEIAQTPDLKAPPFKVYGIIEPASREVYITAASLQRVKQMLVKERDEVHAGQPLVLLENEEKKANLAVIEKGLAAAKASAAISQEKVQRNQALFNKQVVNEADFIQLQLQAAYDEQLVEKAIQELNRARVELDLLTLKAPIEGKIYYNNLHIGQAISPQSKELIMGSKDLRIHLYLESFWINALADIPYNVFHADTQELLGTARLVRFGSYMGPGKFYIDDTTQMADIKYQDVYLAFEPHQENLPLHLVVYVEPR